MPASQYYHISKHCIPEGQMQRLLLKYSHCSYLSTRQYGVKYTLLPRLGRSNESSTMQLPHICVNQSEQHIQLQAGDDDASKEPLVDGTFSLPSTADGQPQKCTACRKGQ